MKVKIQTIGDTPLPEYETSGAVAFDFRAREETTIEPGKLGLVPTGLIIQTPEGYALMVYPRSSTPRKKSLLIPHGAGIIDQDYCGPEDEILLQFYNFSDKPVTVQKDERIGQGIFIRTDRANWEHVELINKYSRGGFGSTDKD